MSNKMIESEARDLDTFMATPPSNNALSCVRVIIFVIYDWRYL